MDVIHHYPENQLIYPNDLQIMKKAISISMRQPFFPVTSTDEPELKRREIDIKFHHKLDEPTDLDHKPMNIYKVLQKPNGTPKSNPLVLSMSSFIEETGNNWIYVTTTNESWETQSPINGGEPSIFILPEIHEYQQKSIAAAATH